MSWASCTQDTNLKTLSSMTWRLKSHCHQPPSATSRLSLIPNEHLACRAFQGRTQSVECVWLRIESPGNASRKARQEHRMQDRAWLA
jgi:hypothetical protein